VDALASATDRHIVTNSDHMMHVTDEIGSLIQVHTVDSENMPTTLVVVANARHLDRLFVRCGFHETNEEIRHTVQVPVTINDSTTMTSTKDVVVIVINVLDAVFLAIEKDSLKIRYEDLHDPEVTPVDQTCQLVTMITIDIVHRHGLDHRMDPLIHPVNIDASTLSLTLRANQAHRHDSAPAEMSRLLHDVTTIQHRLTRPANSRGHQRLIETDDHHRQRARHHRDHPGQTVHGPRPR
jgi:hypothetical protein